MGPRSFLRYATPLACALLAVTSGCSERAGDSAAAPRAVVGKVAKAAASTAAAAVTACSAQQTCTATDAHARHQASGVDCTSCHPCGGKYGFKVGYTFPGGTQILATDGYVPATATAPPSCTVACHAPFGTGPTPTTVAWNTPAPLACVGCHEAQRLAARFPDHPPVSAAMTRADCEACHVVAAQHTTGTVVLQGHAAAWMDPGSGGFHAFAADRGISACQTCHRADLGGGLTQVACADCHRAGGAGRDFATCTGCHGGTDNPTGAPPAALWGYAGDAARGGGAADRVRVGAHTAHVTEGAFGPAMGCEVCHVKPASIGAAGHIDTVAAGGVPKATVTFAGLAVNGGGTPTWTREGATCSGTYCHGASLAGGATPTVKDPSWTGGATQVYCGSCHGVPPLGQHVAVDTTGGFGVCNPCHSFTVDGAGRIIPASQGGKHLNGLVEASGHDAAWMDPASATFHAFSANRGIANCTPCHGADLAGGSVHRACSDCHRAGGRASDFGSCTACHGGAANATGAPPKAIWGYAGDPLRGGGTLDPIRVGAHTRHVTVGRAVAFDCGVCHVKPASLLAAGHVDDPTPVARVTFAGVAVAQAPGPSPSWTRASASCASTYCHGNYQGTYAYTTYDWGADALVQVTVGYAGARATPVWTDGPTTCASCHGNPPGGTGVWHSGRHGGGNDCQLCHPDASGSGGLGTTITDPTRHVNGVVDVAPRWTSRCFGCH